MGPAEMLIGNAPRGTANIAYPDSSVNAITGIEGQSTKAPIPLLKPRLSPAAADRFRTACRA